MSVIDLTILSDRALNSLVDDCYSEFHIREAQKTAAGAYHELASKKNKDGYFIWATPPTLFQAYLPDMLVEHKGKVWRNVLGRMNPNEPGTGEESGWVEFVQPKVTAELTDQEFPDGPHDNTTGAGTETGGARDGAGASA